MIRYLLRRLLNYAIMLFIAVSMAYIIASVALNPLSTYNLQDPHLNKAAILATFTEYHINPSTSVWGRYAAWLHDVFTHWNWGKSPHGASVNSEVSIRVWVSVRLITLGTFIGMIGGMALGAWSAPRQNSWADRVITVVSLLVFSTPTMVMGILLQMGAVNINDLVGFKIFEFIGETSQGYDNHDWLWQLGDRLQHLVLPTLSISLGGIAVYSRYQRNLMLDTLGADYVRTARAKGLTKAQAIRKHALRNALIPMATYFAFAVTGVVLGGAITEQLYGWHGMGVYGVNSILQQDINATAAVVAFSGTMVLLGALLSDILVAVVDPRVRTT